MDFGPVIDACMSTFGETVSYTPTGLSVLSITAIFESQSITLDSGFPVISKNPTLGIKVSDLGTGVNPKVGDTVTVRSVNYKVTDWHDDGQGGAMLQLQKA